MDAVSEDVSTMTDEELAERAERIAAERARRAVVTDAERRTDDTCLDYLRADGRVNGGPFVKPVGMVGAYPRGWRVTEDGKSFEAVVPGATTAPPSDAWVEVPSGEELIDFWEPGEYARDALVRDAGQVWRALADQTDGPRPSEFPGGWVLVN